MGMQGWRKSMEDAHIANLDLPGGVSVFGVFDGHGGKLHSQGGISWASPIPPRGLMVFLLLFVAAYRLRGRSVCQGAFLQGVREAQVVPEQVLQGGPGGMLFQDGRAHGD